MSLDNTRRINLKSRIHYSVLNSTVSASVYIFRMLLGFGIRYYFIQTLGVKNLGLNGLFTNILSFLSLAELGIGTSIVYELYKPVAYSDKDAIKSLMFLYKKAYTFIGVTVAVVGVCIAPLLPFFIHKSSMSFNVYIYYFLFLSNSVVSYFFTYKRSMLNADQQNFKTVINDFIFYIMCAIIQIITLLYYHSFVVYLVIQVLTTLFSNLSISYIVNKKYPFLKEKNVKKLSSQVVKGIKKNVVGNISSQIGAIIVLGSDNILISAFVGLSAVGLYSNYTLIANAVKSLLQQATNSIVPSVGNLISTGNQDKTYVIFNQYLFLNSGISYFAGIGIFSIIDNFIKIWLGKKYILPTSTTVLISLYITMMMYQGAVRTFVSAFGLFWQQRWKSIFESIVNIVMSLIFLLIFKLGINGVLLGTISSTLLITIWFEPFIAFKYGFMKEPSEYIMSTIKFYLFFVINMYVFSYVREWFKVVTVVDFIVYCLITFMLMVFIFLFFCIRNPNFKSFVNRLLSQINKK